jgi:hypothetical protein
MSTINFETQLFKIGSRTILRLPPEASAKLPSRGMTMVTGSINLPAGKAGNISFKTILEPDGRYAPGQNSSHWFRPDQNLLQDANLAAGDIVQVSLKVTKEWIEPEIPEDMQKALSSSPKAEALWKDITPMARWDWFRWVRAVKTQETRKKHLDVMLDKLNKGMRRPCCFNRNLCSDPTVSHNWHLLEAN